MWISICLDFLPINSMILSLKMIFSQRTLISSRFLWGLSSRFINLKIPRCQKLFPLTISYFIYFCFPSIFLIKLASGSFILLYFHRTRFLFINQEYLLCIFYLINLLFFLLFPFLSLLNALKLLNNNKRKPTIHLIKFT